MEHNISSSSAYRRLRTNIEYNEKHPHIHSVCLTGQTMGQGLQLFRLIWHIVLWQTHEKCYCWIVI